MYVSIILMIIFDILNKTYAVNVFLKFLISYNTCLTLLMVLGAEKFVALIEVALVSLVMIKHTPRLFE